VAQLLDSYMMMMKRDRACSTHGENLKCAHNFNREPEWKSRLGDRGRDANIKLLEAVFKVDHGETAREEVE
jgi:hypothetical protein